LTSSKGDPVTLKLLDSEGTVGQSCLFADRNLYSASCMSDTEVCFFPKRIVQQAVSQYPVLFKKLGTISNEEHEALADLIVSLRSKSIVQRVAQSLIKMLSLYGKDENGYIDAEITKEELANLVGTSIESVFRAISHFKKNKYIKFDKRKIMILNESRLRGIASD
jgi:CRP/FNR family transcriptional regulator